MTDTANKYADSRDENYKWLFEDIEIPEGMWLELHPEYSTAFPDTFRYKLLLMEGSGPLDATIMYAGEDTSNAKEMIGNPIPTFLVWRERKKKIENNRRRITTELGF